MKRRFAWFLGLSFVASPAWSQDSMTKQPADSPRSETPAFTGPAPAVANAPAPVSEAFVPMAVAVPRNNCVFGVEFLQWTYKKDAIPSLINTGPETNTQFAGTANDPKAYSLFGPPQYTYKTVPGIRANFAVAIVENIDLEIGGFLMQSSSVNNTFSGVNGQPFLTRPFFNQHDLVEGGFDTSSKSGLSGSINFHTHSQLFGTEANVSWFPCIENNPIYKLSFGIRQISLTESFDVTENVSSSQAPLAPNDKSNLLAFFPTRTIQEPNGVLVNANFDPTRQSIRIIDGINTSNEFYGPQAVAQWRWHRGPFSFDLLTKVAVGVNHESINTSGTTSLLTNGVVTKTGPGGLLVVATNSGLVTADELTVVPELGLKFTFDMNSHLHFNAGYNMLYMTSVARPGNQIDRRINPQLVPSDIAYYPTTSGPFFPRGFFRDTDFYAHGITFGIEVSY